MIRAWIRRRRERQLDEIERQLNGLNADYNIAQEQCEAAQEINWLMYDDATFIAGQILRDMKPLKARRRRILKKLRGE